MENSTNPTPMAGAVRPTLLTVVCILTFIGSGLSIIRGINSYINADAKAKMAAEVLNKLSDDPQANSNSFVQKILGSDRAAASVDSIRGEGLIALISSLFTLAGAVMMWTLRKNGFYVYIAGIIIWVTAPLVFSGAGLFIKAIIAGGCAFIGILFIVLYAANLKAMTKQGI